LGRFNRAGILFLGAMLSAAVIVTMLVASLQYIEIGNLQRENSRLSSEIGAQNAGSQSVNVGGNSLNTTATWLAHLAKLEALNPDGALRDYAPNAAVVVSGSANGAGAGGVYKGASEIKNPLIYFFGNNSNLGSTLGSFHSKNFNFTVKSFNSTGGQPKDSITIDASLGFVGFSTYYGNFNGTILARYQYSNSGGGMLISREDWNFAAINEQYPIHA